MLLILSAASPCHHHHYTRQYRQEKLPPSQIQHKRKCYIETSPFPRDCMIFAMVQPVLRRISWVSLNESPHTLHIAPPLQADIASERILTSLMA